MIDVYSLEYHTVRFRNWLHNKIEAKDSSDRLKIFVVGHPRTATGTLHRTLEANGLNSKHTAGRWRTRAYDCFADRGNYQPLGALKKDYPNAVFLLNTRPAAHYIYSRLNRYVRINERKARPRPTFSRHYIKGEILRRNRHFVRFARLFMQSGDFLIFNIERPDSFNAVKEHLELDHVPEHKPATGRTILTEAEISLVRECFEELNIPDEMDNPFVIHSLLDSEQDRLVRDFINQHHSRLLL